MATAETPQVPTATGEPGRTKLRDFLDRKLISPADFAKLLHVSRTSVYRWISPTEHGRPDVPRCDVISEITENEICVADFYSTNELERMREKERFLKTAEHVLHNNAKNVRPLRRKAKRVMRKAKPERKTAKGAARASTKKVRRAA